jgi:hypothetical protein
MKLIPLVNSDKFAMVDDTDYDWLSQWIWRLDVGKTGIEYAKRFDHVGPIRPAYWSTRKTESIYMHREILGLTDRRIKTDHRDGNGLNNQRFNLRAASHGQNLANARQWKGTRGVPPTSRYRGVSWHQQPRRWRAVIQFNKKQINLGNFRTEEAAAKAYDKAAKRLFGEFAHLNFPTERRNEWQEDRKQP